MDLDLLKKLVVDISEDLDRSQKKESVNEEITKIIKTRSNNVCELCNKYKSGRIHHIIPNGPANEVNLIDLCIHCHDAIHLLLYTSRKWKFPYKPNNHY